MTTRFQLRHAHCDALQNVQRLKACRHNRDLDLAAIGMYSP